MFKLYCACRSRKPCPVTYQSYWKTTWNLPVVGTSNSTPWLYSGAAVFQPLPVPTGPAELLSPRTRQELELKSLLGSVLPSVEVMSEPALLPSVTGEVLNV